MKRTQHTYMKKQLKARLKVYTKDLDAETQEVIFDLAERLDQITQMIKNFDTDALIENQIGFIGKSGGVLFGNHPRPLELMLEGDMANLKKKKQFATFAENRRYCEGTEGLLGILTRYDSVVTLDATITAIPDACVFQNEQAIFNEEDREIYGEDRSVYVSVILKDGFMMFAFHEKANLNQKVLPQKVYRKVYR
jgi:hypothetical protein